MHDRFAHPLLTPRSGGGLRLVGDNTWPWSLAVAVLTTAAALMLSLVLRRLVLPNPFLFFFGAVALSAWAGGLRAGVIATGLSVVVVNVVLLSSSGSSPLAPDIVLRSALFVLVALLISSLSEARRRAELHSAAVGLAMEQSREQLARIQAITAGLAGALTPADVAGVITRQGIAALGASGSLVALVMPEGDALEIIGGNGYPPELIAQFRRIPLDRPTPLADCFHAGAPILIGTREQAAARYPELASAVETTRLHAWANLPLIVNGAVIGAIEFSFAAPSDLEPRRGLLTTLADQCAQALDRARLYAAEHAALAAAEEALRQRDAFLAVAAHELRTPLTAILGQSQLLARRLEREEQLAESLRVKAQVVVQQSQRLSNLVSALLDVSRIDQGVLSLECAPLDLGALVRRIVEEVAPLHPRHQISFAQTDAAVCVDGDSMRLEQVLQNLIGNAVRYSPDGGPVRLDLRAEGRQAALTVSDEGIGIPAEALPRLFTRFFRASNASEYHGAGLGVGLYVVREVIALHQGTVEVQSAEGHGSSFTVRLPLLEGAPPLAR